MKMEIPHPHAGGEIFPEDDTYENRSDRTKD